MNINKIHEFSQDLAYMLYENHNKGFFIFKRVWLTKIIKILIINKIEHDNVAA